MNGNISKIIVLIGSWFFVMFFFVWFFGSIANVTSDVFLKNIFESFHKGALYSLILVIIVLIGLVVIFLVFLYYRTSDESSLPAL